MRLNGLNGATKSATCFMVVNKGHPNVCDVTIYENCALCKGRYTLIVHHWYKYMGYGCGQWNEFYNGLITPNE